VAFWKKSEDPWDIDPEKKRRKTEPWVEVQERMGEEEAPKIGFLSELLKKKEDPAEEEVSVPCPYCGKTMKKVYLKGGRDRVYLSETKPGFMSAFDEAWLISDEGGLWTAAYRTCCMCEDCSKLIVDIPEPTGPNYVWKDGQSVLPEEQEKASEE